MKLISTVNYNKVSDFVDCEGDICIVTKTALNSAILSLFYLNKSGAAILVEHLQETFGLEK